MNIKGLDRLVCLLMIGFTFALLGCGGGPTVPPNGTTQEPPLELSFTINSNAEKTSLRNVTLYLTTANATEMYITQDGSCNTGGSWVPYSSTPSYTLKNFNKLNTVYVKVRNATTSSECVYDHIFHEVIGPYVTIETPAANSYAAISNESSYSVQGYCSEPDATIQITSPVTSSATCTANGDYSATLDLSSVAQGNFTLTTSMTDSFGTTKTASVSTLIKDTVAPTLTLDSPLSGDSFSSSEVASVTFSGTCSEDTRNVAITGAITDTVACTSGTWSKNLNLSTVADGSFQLNFNHQDAAGNAAMQISSTYTKDTSAPTLSITTPADAAYVNSLNQTSYTLSGACSENGSTVTIAGSISTTATCTSLAWSVNYNFSASAEGPLSITASISDTSGNTTTTAARNFTKDVTAPGDIVITNPASSPHPTATNTLTISGTCDGSSSLQVTGAQTLSGSCSSGTFSLNLAQAVDGTYNYTIKQSDAAGNPSAGVGFTWIVDTAIPATPVLSSPNPNPTITNLDSLVIAGSCVTGNTVTLSGDVDAAEVTSPAGSLTQICASNTFSFTLQKFVDATYSFSVDQTNLVEVTSAPANITWTRDTIVPDPVVITNPLTNPYTAGGSLLLAGTCEIGATVSVTGSNTASMTCDADGTFSFTLNQATDGTYNYSIRQTDAATNASTIVTQQWVRDSSVLPPPAITNPTTASVTTKNNSITISGTCVTGYTVTLASGALASEVSSPLNSLTQVCLGTFSFTINKSTDASYTFTFTQTDGATTSPAVSRVWVRDTVPPNTTISSSPLNPNHRLKAAFGFTSSETGSTFECNYDGGGWSSCVTPKTYSTVTNANHTFEVRATDKAGNTDPTPASFSWTQDAYKTVALYHFDLGSEFVDSSFYTGAQNNPLTNTSTTANPTAKFNEGRTLSSQYMTAVDNNSLDVLDEQMTVDLWVKFNAYPTNNGQYAILVSKYGAAGQISWEFSIRRTSGSYRPALRASIDGTTVVERRATSSCFSDTTTWHHVAFTWNMGTVTFYCDGVAKGSGVIGTAGTSKLFTSTASVRLGRSQTVSTTYQNFNGSMDEVRLSQVLRWTSGFTPPAVACTPD